MIERVSALFPGVPPSRLNHGIAQKLAYSGKELLTHGRVPKAIYHPGVSPHPAQFAGRHRPACHVAVERVLESRVAELHYDVVDLGSKLQSGDEG